jgi:hypothetical protein
MGGLSILTAALLAGLSGCGAQGQTKQSVASQPISFQNETKEMLVTPDQTLDPSIPRGVDYTRIQAVNGDGQTVTLDAERTSILVVAYWCPHCQRTLKLLSQYRPSLDTVPVLLNVGYPSGTTLSEAVHVEQEEERALGLHGMTSFYDLDPSAGDKYAPKGYPTLVYKSSRGLNTLFGEHTLAVWKQVLAGATG